MEGSAFVPPSADVVEPIPHRDQDLDNIGSALSLVHALFYAKIKHEHEATGKFPEALYQVMLRLSAVYSAFQALQGTE